jgi:signal transduction histidine kinase
MDKQRPSQENLGELGALSAELKAKRSELETFVYTVSHELKAPVVTIEGFIKAFREDFGELIPDEADRYLGYIDDAARKMKLLVDDLLELSRIGRLHEEKVEFSFSSLVEDVLSGFKAQIDGKGIEIAIHGDFPAVYGERKRLTVVMENLLSNAIKYIGKHNPRPRIELGAKKRDGEYVFFVRDNGMGIEQVYEHKIFQVFQRSPAARKEADGTGVGLAIVKRIVEHHEGNIWVETQLGKGSTFFFTLKAKAY